MPKQIKSNELATETIKSVTEKFCDVIASTLGPKGSFVSLQSDGVGLTTTTNDGATIAKSISLQDQTENAIVSILNEGSQKSNTKVGDGTTSTLVIARSIILEGLKYKAAGANAVSLKTGIDKAVSKIVDKINSMSIPVKDDAEVKKVATISANGDEVLGELISNAFHELGLSSVLTIEESKTGSDSFTPSMGLEIRNPAISPYFMIRAKDDVLTLKEPFILLYDKTISQMKPLVPILEKVMQTGKPLLIVCENMDGEALSTIIMNVLQNPSLNICVVKSQYYGDKKREFMNDIAALCNGRMISEEAGMSLEKTTLDDLGKCEKVTIDREKTTIIGGKGSDEAKAERVAKIKRDIEHAESEFDKDSLKERLAKIESGVGIIRIGGRTDNELNTRKLLAEDAYMSSRCAIESGVVTGGGVTLLRAMNAADEADYKNSDEKLGCILVKNACKSILNTIAENAGENGEYVVEMVLSGEGDFGYNAATGTYEDLAKAGVIEPTLVLTNALTNGSAVASQLLITNHIVANLPESNESLILSTKPGVIM